MKTIVVAYLVLAGVVWLGYGLRGVVTLVGATAMIAVGLVVLGLIVEAGEDRRQRRIGRSRLGLPRDPE